MSSLPVRKTQIHPLTVWRDALGPGYAVGAAEGLIRVAGTAAQRPYRVRR